MNRWNNKVSVVTGASAGIGLEIAKSLLREGVHVVGLARRKQKMEEEMKNLPGAKGKFYAVQCDVSSPDDVKKAFQWIKNNVGTVQILINNAGLAFIGSTSTMEEEKIRTVVDVNLMGVIWCSREALKIMQESKSDESIIININSIEGHRVLKFLDLDVNVYPATKHAVTGFSETIRMETLGGKIRVTNLSPGLVKTDIAEGFEADIWSEPHLKSKDIADACLYVIGAPSHVQITELTIRPLGERCIAH